MITSANRSHRGRERSKEADLDNYARDLVRPISAEAGEWIRHDAHTTSWSLALPLSLFLIHARAYVYT